MKPITFPTGTFYLGDNLEILKSMDPQSVDLIYLDPPFNTGRNFNWADGSFNDNFSRGEIEQTPLPLPRGIKELITLAGEFYKQSTGNYLAFMAPRIIEMHRVLKPTGFLYLHCDHNASHYLKLLLDAVFGGRNFRNEITWQRSYSCNTCKSKYPNLTDVILFYSKTNKAKFNPQYKPHRPEYVKQCYRYSDDDDDTGKKWQPNGLLAPLGGKLHSRESMSAPNSKEYRTEHLYDRGDDRSAYRGSPLHNSREGPGNNCVYSWKGFWPPKNRAWRCTKENMQKLHDEGRIHYPRNPDGSLDHSRQIAKKTYLHEVKGVLIPNIWTDIGFINSQAKERVGYPTQKPVALLERIIKASSNEGDTVLDPFCGSGTTLVAAESLNRRWVGIDISDKTPAILKKRLGGEPS